MIGALSSVGVWVFFNHPLGAFEASIALVASMVVLLKLWLTSEVCQRWIEDRRSGALELLLCSPLELKEVVKGQGMALRRQFAWPVAAVLVLLWLTVAVIPRASGQGLSFDPVTRWLLIGALVSLADLAALRWVAMWMGLTSRGLNRAMLGTLARVLWLRWCLYFFFMGIAFVWTWAGLGQGLSLSSPWWWFALALGLDLAFGWSARQRFFRNARLIAASPKEWRSAISEGTLAHERMPEGATEGAFDAKDVIARAASLAKRRKLKLVLRWAAIASIILGAPLAYHLMLHLRLERRVSAMRARGLPTTMQELARARPALTNGVDTADLLERLAPQLVHADRLAPDLQRHLWTFMHPHRFAASGLTPEARAAMQSLLSSNQVALSLLQSAPSLKAGRYEFDVFGRGSPRMGNQMRGLFTVKSLLTFDALLRSDDGDVAGTLAALRRLVDLGRSLDQELQPTLQTYRQMIHDGALTVIQHWLRQHRITDAVLMELEKLLAELQATANPEPEYPALKCFLLEVKRSSPSLIGQLAAGGLSTKERIQFALSQQLRSLSGADTRDLIAVLDAIDEFVRLENLPWTQRLRRAEQLAPRRQSDRRGGAMLHSAFTPDYVFDHVLGHRLAFEARLRLALLALSIERFRLRNNHLLPETLAEVTPPLPLELTTDPFDGQPVRFNWLSAGYRLYSVGINGTDDGGGIDPPAPVRPGAATRDDIEFAVGR